MPICSLPKWSHNVFALQIYKFLSIWARVSCNFIFDIGNKMECLNRCKPMIYREIEIKNEELVSSSFWAVDEAWTRYLFLTKEVLYHWATTAISLFEWCKNSIKKTFLKFLLHFLCAKIQNPPLCAIPSVANSACRADADDKTDAANSRHKVCCDGNGGRNWLGRFRVLR